MATMRLQAYRPRASTPIRKACWQASLSQVRSQMHQLREPQKMTTDDLPQVLNIVILFMVGWAAGTWRSQRNRARLEAARWKTRYDEIERVCAHVSTTNYRLISENRALYDQLIEANVKAQGPMPGKPN